MVGGALAAIMVAMLVGSSLPNIGFNDDSYFVLLGAEHNLGA